METKTSLEPKVNLEVKEIKGIIELTEKEATVMLQLFDLALKHSGISIVDNVSYLNNKIQEAFKSLNK